MTLFSHLAVVPSQNFWKVLVQPQRKAGALVLHTLQLLCLWPFVTQSSCSLMWSVCWWMEFQKFFSFLLMWALHIFGGSVHAFSETVRDGHFISIATSATWFKTYNHWILTELFKSKTKRHMALLKTCIKLNTIFLLPQISPNISNIWIQKQLAHHAGYIYELA